MDSNVLISIVVLLIVFLIFRELVCWYWKINRIVELLESIERNTKIAPAERISETV